MLNGADTIPRALKYCPPVIRLIRQYREQETKSSDYFYFPFLFCCCFVYFSSTKKCVMCFQAPCSWMLNFQWSKFLHGYNSLWPSLLLSLSSFHWPSLLDNPIPLCKMQKLTPRNLQDRGSLPLWAVSLKKKKGIYILLKTDFHKKCFAFSELKKFLVKICHYLT